MFSRKLFIAALLAATAAPASAVTFELVNQGGVEAGTDAFRGFTAASRFWETILTNDSTVKLNVRFAALAPGVLGSTGSTTQVASIEQTLAAIKETGNSRLDKRAVLPTLTPVVGDPGFAAISVINSAPKPDGTGVLQPVVRILDNDQSGNNVVFSANTSLVKALGFQATYAAANTTQIDGSVSFSNSFAFDFDPGDGITEGSFDFIGVAIHEIGHALGFRSGVDTYDGNRNFAGDLNNFAIFSVWDAFRYSASSAALGINDWAIGGTGVDAPYFSIDGGLTAFGGEFGPAFMSTGRFLGDGQQASHWKDNLVGSPQLGIMDPTLSRARNSIVEGLDIAAFDAMGWNIAYDVLASPNKSFSTAIIPTLGAVPEPATWAMMIGGFGLVGATARRRRTAVAA